MEEQILQLLNSGQVENIILAFQLAKGIKFDITNHAVKTYGQMISLEENSPLTILQADEKKFTADVMEEKIIKLLTAEDIDLSHKMLSEVPKNIHLLKNAKLINLSGNWITNISDNLLKTHAKTLTLSYNSLSIIPEELFQMPTLESVFLQNNPSLVLPNVKYIGSNL